MLQRTWEDYVDRRDRLEALDRLPRSAWTDAKARELARLLRDAETMPGEDLYDLNARYDDDPNGSKEPSILRYVEMYKKEQEAALHR